MIKSMTAFARQGIEEDWGNGGWEIRSVNSRFLEINFRLPEAFRYLEFKLREKLRKKLSRGKLDCSLRIEVQPIESNCLTLDTQLAASLLKAHRSFEQVANIAQEPNLTRLLSWPGMVQTIELNSEAFETSLLNSLDQAIDQLSNMRAIEGSSIRQMLQQRLDEISRQVSNVRGQMPAIVDWQKEKILARFEEVKLEFEQQRIEQEMVLIAQKIDVDEELDRLETHTNEILRLLKKGGVVGRRLDFLMQELNREANTLGSKSINSKTTTAAVELKVLIEQMREQIQNIE